MAYLIEAEGLFKRSDRLISYSYLLARLLLLLVKSLKGVKPSYMSRLPYQTSPFSTKGRKARKKARLL